MLGAQRRFTAKVTSALSDTLLLSNTDSASEKKITGKTNTIHSTSPSTTLNINWENSVHEGPGKKSLSYFIISWYCSLYSPVFPFAVFLTVVLFQDFKIFAVLFWFPFMYKAHFLSIFFHSAAFSLTFISFFFVCPLHFSLSFFIKILEAFWFYLHLREIWLCISVWCMSVHLTMEARGLYQVSSSMIFPIIWKQGFSLNKKLTSSHRLAVLSSRDFPVSATPPLQYPSPLSPLYIIFILLYHYIILLLPPIGAI